MPSPPKNTARLNKSNHIWTKKELNFLLLEWNRESCEFIAHELKLTRGVVRYQARKLGLQEKKEIEKWGWRATQFVLNNYRTHTNDELIIKLNEMFPYVKRKFSKNTLPAQFEKLGIVRTEEEKATMYQRLSAKGSYKNNGGYNEKEIGHISLKPDYYNNKGERKPAYIIKVANDRWQLFKHYVWEQHWGPIPKGYQISCLNGDDLNFAIEDLIITKKNASAIKAAEELSDNYVLSFYLLHRSDKEEIKALYQKNPESFKGLIETLRANLKLQRTKDGKKKNK